MFFIRSLTISSTHAQTHILATSMSPPTVQQVISMVKVVTGEGGSNKAYQNEASKILSRPCVSCLDETPNLVIALK